MEHTDRQTHLHYAFILFPFRQWRPTAQSLLKVCPDNALQLAYVGKQTPTLELGLAILRVCYKSVTSIVVSIDYSVTPIVHLAARNEVRCAGSNLHSSNM
jgi:hypothetical protein